MYKHRKIKISLLLTFSALLGFQSLHSQSIIYTDQFNSACEIGSGLNMPCTNGNGYGAGAQKWQYTEIESTFGPSVNISGGILTHSNSFGVNTANGANFLFKRRSGIGPAGDGYYAVTGAGGYTSTFTNNDSLLVWTINFRTTDNIWGFTNGGAMTSNTAAAFILGQNNNLIESCYSGIFGYAVVMGDATPNDNDAIRLVKYANVPLNPGDPCGPNTQSRYAFFNWNGTESTTCLASANDLGVPDNGDWYSIKVVYDPTTEEWSLYARNDGATKQDPRTLNSSHCKGKAIDNTYTSQNLPYMGTYAAFGDGSSDIEVYWDNETLEQIPLANHPGCVETPGCSCLLTAAPTNPSNRSICPAEGTSFTFDPNAGGGETHQWQYSNDNVNWNNVVNGTPATAVYSGASSATLTVSGVTAAGPHYYRDFSVSTGGCNRVSQSASLNVFVLETTTMDQTSQVVAACSSPGLINLTSSPSNAINYEWYYQTGSVSCPTGSVGSSPSGWSLGATTPQVSIRWSDDFDGTNNWTLSGNFAIGTPSGGTGNTVTAANTPPNALTTVLNGNYLANETEAVNYAISPIIDLTGVSNPTLLFDSRSWFRRTSCFSGCTTDRGKVYLSIDNGANWTLLEDNSWNEGAWSLHSISIPSAANKSQVRIRFTMLSDGSNEYNGWNIDNIRINGEVPITYSPSNDPLTTYALAVTDANGCKRWADNCQVVTVDACPMPVEFGGASIYCELNKTVINWQTESENNNDYFTILRSIDGINYIELSSINSYGNSATSRNYSFEDDYRYAGLKYYKIEQTDIDGSRELLAILSSNKMCEDLNEMQLYPNPTNSNLNIILPENNLDVVNVEIYNALGQIIKSESKSKIANSQNLFFNIDLHEISSGIYHIRVIAGGKIYNEKFLIEK